MIFSELVMRYQPYKLSNNFIYEPALFNESSLIRQWSLIKPGTHLSSSNRQSITVINRGELNKFDGPDFLNAILLIDGLLKIGSIECHLVASDWYKHGHDKNKRYNDVILHVVNNASKNKKNPDIPTVYLLKNNIDKRGCSIPSNTTSSAVELLRKYSDQRWKQKIEQYSGMHNKPHKLFTKLIENSYMILGASGNKENFVRLSKNINLDTTTQLSIQELEIYLIELCNKLEIIWNTKSVRPAHQPINRMRLAAEIVKFYYNLTISPQIDSNNILKEFRLKCPSARGKGIKAEIIGNVLLPYIASKILADKIFKQYNYYYEVWRGIKLMTPYQKYVKRFEQIIDRSTLKMFWIMQGAIQIDTIWCKRNLCDICPLKNKYDNN